MSTKSLAVLEAERNLYQSAIREMEADPRCSERDIASLRRRVAQTLTEIVWAIQFVGVTG